MTAATSYGIPFDRRFYGVVEGIVEEIVDPDKLGRIKVSFPWYHEGTVTEWCRVQQPYAGNGYGAFFIPEKGDEVVVAFVHGDMTIPVIMGGLYNGKDRPPTDRQEDRTKNHKLIRTKAGHTLLFDDTDKKQKVVLASKSGHTLEMVDEGGKEHLELHTAGGHSVGLDDAGKQITIKTSGGQTIVMDAISGGITLSGVTLTLVGSVTIGLEAPAVDFSGASVSLSSPSVGLGSAPTDRVVLGDKLMALFNGHTHPIPAGSTGTPTVPMTDAVLSNVAKVQ